MWASTVELEAPFTAMRRVPPCLRVPLAGVPVAVEAAPDELDPLLPHAARAPIATAPPNTSDPWRAFLRVKPPSLSRSSMFSTLLCQTPNGPFVDCGSNSYGRSCSFQRWRVGEQLARVVGLWVVQHAGCWSVLHDHALVEHGHGVSERPH